MVFAKQLSAQFPTLVLSLCKGERNPGCANGISFPLSGEDQSEGPAFVSGRAMVSRRPNFRFTCSESERSQGGAATPPYRD